jgi:hypothetical protein
MSTNCRYSHVSSQDSDLDSRGNQFYSTPVVSLPEDELDKLQEVSQDDHKPHKENSYQEFTNFMTSGILQIPNWPGPQILEKTRTESIVAGLGYILCLMPPLFFLSKDTIRTMRGLN